MMASCSNIVRRVSIMTGTGLVAGLSCSFSYETFLSTGTHWQHSFYISGLLHLLVLGGLASILQYSGQVHGYPCRKPTPKITGWGCEPTDRRLVPEMCTSSQLLMHCT
jgi:hypothetical protein